MKLIVIIALVLCATAAVDAQQPPPPATNALYRINCGGPDYADLDGNTWAKDFGFNWGSIYYNSSEASPGTKSPDIYKSERWSTDSSKPLQYSFPVPSASTYKLQLHFAEIYFPASFIGGRVFHVDVEGVRVLESFDISAEVSYATPIVKEFAVTVLDGAIDIVFQHVKQNPKINGIVISLPTGNPRDPGATEGSVIQRIRCGSLSPYTDQNGSTWSPDQFFSAGKSFATSGSIEGTLDDPLFQSERYWPTFEYTIPAPQPGRYMVDLLFSEIYFKDPGLRLINVDVNMDRVLSNYDILSEVAPFTAVMKSFPTMVNGTTISIKFSSPNQNAKVSAIMVTFRDSPISTTLPVPTSTSSPGVSSSPSPVPGKGEAALYRVNCGGNDYQDSSGNSWQADLAFVNTGRSYVTSRTIIGTSDSSLYQTHRWDEAAVPEMVYSFPIENSPTSVSVRLHFAETYSKHAVATARVFSVHLEEQTVFENLDVFAESGGLDVALIKETVVRVEDGELNVGFVHVTENPMIAAIEVLSASGLLPDQTVLDFGHNDPGTSTRPQGIVWTNTASSQAQVTGLQMSPLTGSGSAWKVISGSQEFVGRDDVVEYPWSVVVPPGGTLSLSFVFSPAVAEEYGLGFQLIGVANPLVELHGEGFEGAGDPFLHVVINVDPVIVDFDGDGLESVNLVGRFSHTHELGRVLAGFEWSENGAIFGSSSDVTASFALGTHDIRLKISDDNFPSRTLTGSASFKIISTDQVPGTLIQYFVKEEPLNNFLDVLPENAQYADRGSGFQLQIQDGSVGSSPYKENIEVQLLGTVAFPTAGSYTFVVTGGREHLIFIDGSRYTSGPVSLAQGSHNIELRVDITALSNLPLELTYSLGSGTLQPIDPSLVSHDENSILPVINSLEPIVGPTQGGYFITMRGLGFQPVSSLKVLWGTSLVVSGNQLALVGEELRFTAPPGTAGSTVLVSLQNSIGMSRSVLFSYSSSGPVPIQFGVSDLVKSITNPTRAVWGADHRLYVSTIEGVIHAYTLDDTYNVVATQTVSVFQSVPNSNILGLAVNPYDAAGEVRIYVSHSKLFGNGGGCKSGPLDYSGQISVITGPNFGTVVPLVTGLPVGNSDHGLNGMFFDQHGDLLVCVGSQTNAGIPSCALGNLPESPLSAAVLKVSMSDKPFNGQVVYRETATCRINNDQVFGDRVDLVSGLSVSVFAAGLRNPFSVTMTSRGLLYASDNGMNANFGETSTGANSKGVAFNEPDQIQLVDIGRYQGHPNRNRGRYDERQNVHYNALSPKLPGVYEGVLSTFPPSSNGLFEYRATTFNSAMLGNLISQKWNGATSRLVLKLDGTLANSSVFLTTLASLDTIQGPGGVIIGVDYSASRVRKAVPDDVSIGTTVRAIDIFPWRAPSKGGKSFVIGGANFGSLADTTVTIGGAKASLTRVSSNRILGILPAALSSPGSLVDVIVTSRGMTSVLASSFMFLRPAGPSAFVRAEVSIGTTSGDIRTSTTTSSNYFQIVNQASQGQKIRRARLSLTKAVLRDLVFDPNGLAGDTVSKGFTVDTGGSATGYSGIAFFSPHDGGFDTLEIVFRDFGPGKTFGFSVDVDPTSIKGTNVADGPGNTGSVNGLELSGSDFYIEFDDESILRGEVVGISPTMSRNLILAQPPPRVGLSSASIPCISATVTSATHTLVIAGPSNTPVHIVHIEAAQYLGSFELGTYEANNILSYTSYSAVIGASGTASVPITLKRSISEGGYNVVFAASTSGVGTGRSYGPVSDTLVFLYRP